jgi:hypothetical protein
MRPFVNAARCGPECSGREYVFRGPKTVSGQAGKPAAVGRKYTRKACGHAWQERLAVKEAG